MQQLEVLKLLADGERHSGEALARDLGVTRAAVWKQVSKLGQWGLEVEPTRGRGYQLSCPIELLDRGTILGALQTDTAQRISSLEVFSELESTNRYLLAAPGPAPGRLTACLAEFQSAGRGRRGRPWSAPFGGGLCLSTGWLFDEMPRDLSALALAVGVTARRVILEITGCSPSIKWPNDLVWADRKLGGILVELSAECQGSCYVVIGIGINVSMGADCLEAVSDWTHGAVDLARMTEGSPPSRNVLAGRLIEGLVELLVAYESGGFREHHAEFVNANYLQGRRVAVVDGQRSFLGEAVAVDSDGALIVQTETGRRQRIISGEVSVRPA